MESLKFVLLSNTSYNIEKIDGMIPNISMKRFSFFSREAWYAVLVYMQPMLRNSSFMIENRIPYLITMIKMGRNAVITCDADNDLLKIFLFDVHHLNQLW